MDLINSTMIAFLIITVLNVLGYLFINKVRKRLEEGESE